MDLHNIIILKRQELYDKVWSTPMNKLCKLYKLSDNGLRKICKKMDIPTTPAGYWVKLRYNKKVELIPLPAPDSNTILEYKVYPEKEKTPLKMLTDLPAIKISENLKNSHPLIKDAILYNKGNKSINPKPVLTLNFSKELLKRGILLLSTIFYELEKRNCNITFREDNYYYSKYPAATLDDDSVHFHLYEITKAKKPDIETFLSPKYEYTYTGLLQFKIEGYFMENIRKTYTEGAKRKIEDFLPTIINSIMTALDYEKTLRIHHEEKRKEEERLRVIRENEKKRIAEENRKWELLKGMAVQLNTFEAIQLLISKIRNKYNNDISTNIKLNEWLNWAEQANEKNNPIDSISFLTNFYENSILL